MKKQLGILGLTIVLALSAGYLIGLHKQCTTVILYSDYKFTCDGHKIQGPSYPKEYVTHSWEFHSK